MNKDANLLHHHALESALTASREWVASFNAGDAGRCADTYLDAAVMQATPFGTFTGRDAIRAFWTDLVAKGARDLVYTEIQLDQVDDETVVLSANWTMNIGGGRISREEWVRRDGRWMLADDRFAVLTQN